MSGRILIAAAIPAERILLRATLASHAYDVLLASSAQAVLDHAQGDRPDVILLSETLDGSCGIELCRRLRADPETSRLPLILRTGAGERGGRLRALAAGADAVMDADTAPSIVAARIRSLMRRVASGAELDDVVRTPGLADAIDVIPHTGRVALIVPAELSCDLWRAEMQARIRGPLRVCRDDTALTELRAGDPPDAIVVVENPAVPEMALRLVSELRCRSATMRAAILLVQSEPGWDRAVMALDIGVDDLIETGFDPEEVSLRLRHALARKAYEDRCRAALRDGARLAVTDPLTGLANRRFAMDRLRQIAERNRGASGAFAVLALDLDRFKCINDTYGHPAGDAVLAEVARRMEGTLRQGDLLARMGGEEFMAVIFGCRLDQAARTADRLREAVSCAPVRLPDGTEIPVTISIGVAISDGSASGRPDPAALMAQADRALYAAKADGRNQVTVSSHAA
ncbi:diguanylate cyclase [Psychromarinibacter sp. S121]|uniref:diguanylate cyclase n=1 Tax=Psychromarinibacter sp. S121 TaxID=3415127 RepID=UPI003C7EA392